MKKAILKARHANLNSATGNNTFADLLLLSVKSKSAGVTALKNSVIMGMAKRIAGKPFTIFYKRAVAIKMLSALQKGLATEVKRASKLSSGERAMLEAHLNEFGLSLKTGEVLAKFAASVTLDDVLKIGPKYGITFELGEEKIVGNKLMRNGKVVGVRAKKKAA